MEHFDLIIVGTGSGNSIPAEFDTWRIALVERDVFGGTCLNRGCIPSKMFVYAADVAASVSEGARLGVHATLDRVDWPSIVERVFGRIDAIAAGGEDYRSNRCPNITVFRGHGRFVGPKVVEVNGQEITAPQILLAAGARPQIPDLPGLATSGYYTSDNVMRLTELPERMVVLGGGYIAAELGHVFGSFGTKVTYIVRGPALLREQDDDISRLMTQAYAERFEVITSATDLVFGKVNGRTVVSGVSKGERFTATADALLVATGRIPNGDELEVATSGIDTAADGRRVLSNDALATNVAGIWALGDLTNTKQLKHLANAEGRIVFHNIALYGPNGDATVDPSQLRRINRTLVPAAVFGHPQVATVGLRERDAVAAGIPYVVASKEFGSTAYGWAMDDSTSICKLIAHRETRLLLGAHLVGPQASTLIQPLIQAMHFGQTVDQLAHDVWYIHPALTEVVENALLDLC